MVPTNAGRNVLDEHACQSMALLQSHVGHWQAQQWYTCASPAQLLAAALALQSSGPIARQLRQRVCARSLAVLSSGSTWLQMLIVAETADHAVHSLLLQNAETVRLVGPAEQSSTAFGKGTEMNGESKDDGAAGWRAVSVSQMQVGDRVYLRQQGAARHTGISIEESIVER